MHRYHQRPLAFHTWATSSRKLCKHRDSCTACAGVAAEQLSSIPGCNHGRAQPPELLRQVQCDISCCLHALVHLSWRCTACLYLRSSKFIHLRSTEPCLHCFVVAGTLNDTRGGSQCLYLVIVVEEVAVAPQRVEPHVAAAAEGAGHAIVHVRQTLQQRLDVRAFRVRRLRTVRNSILIRPGCAQW